MNAICIISFTGQGCRLSGVLRAQLEKKGRSCQSYGPERFANGVEILPLPEEPRQWIKSRWGEDSFVFIGAAGIALRYIAGCIKDKYTDSAVLAMDERGQFVIPLLSGHAGGGVALAREIAACTGATPVITTATDVEGKFAVDVFAENNGLQLKDRTLAKVISAGVLEGKTIGFYSFCPVEGEPPKELTVCKTPEALGACSYGIAVTTASADLQLPAGQKVLPLYARPLTVGIGCRKGVSCEQLYQGLLQVLALHRRKPEEIGAVASIDLKKEEPGMLQLCQELGVPYHTYSAEELRRVEKKIAPSPFVEQTTGVDNVCERAAWRCAWEGRLLQPKTILEKMTFAVVEREVTVRF